MAEIQFDKETWEVSDALQAFYVPYASYVIQTRALPDARDGLKTGARFILYSQFKDKLTYKEKRRKAVATVNAAMRFSPHGDSSILGTAVRMSQDFSLRYPIIEVQGNNGSYLSGDDYSQARYLEMRGNKIAWDMTNLLGKDTIDEWKLNYTEEEEYPTVLPSKFPYSLVNGSYGIGVACASSIPPHNLCDVCEAIVTLIKNPNASFEEIYCPIDFPTGGTIINENAVRESLKNGTGKAALVRASIDYDDKDNELIVREVPYMTFTNTIVASISRAIEEGLLIGVESVIDGTDFDGCKIYIQLSKGANVNRVLKLLYKHTALQSSFSINMNMLENGKIPKLFTWKEAMQAYVNHLRNIIVKAYEFDLKKLLKRIHILEGLIIAYQNIEEVVKLIRAAASTTAAHNQLKEHFGLTDEQSEAILKMKLANLTHLEIEKLENEKEEKEAAAQHIQEILSSEEKIKEEMINDVMTIKKEYGDERKTKNISLDFTSEDEDAEPIEKKELLIHYTNLGNIYTVESSTLLRTRRGAKGTKIKLAANEAVTQTLRDDNFSSLLVFSNKGQMYHISTDNLPLNSKINVAQLFEFKADEKPTALTTIQRKAEKDYFCFITKLGMIKKTFASEYNIKRGKSLKAINLKENDEVLKVLFINDEDISLVSNTGNFVRIDTTLINPIGRAAAGVKGINLKENESVINAVAVPAQAKFLVTISESGIIKKMSINDFPQTSRAIRGKKISETKENDRIIGYLILNQNSDIIIIVNKKLIKINTNELRELSRNAYGVKGVDLKENERVVGLVKEEEI